MPHASILYVTLGCAKNEVDTDRMRSLLNGAGYDEVFEADQADAVIINTCSFLASATSESIETTLALAEEVAEGVRDTRIVMCGCVPSRYGADLPEELPEVAAFARADEEAGTVPVLDGAMHQSTAKKTTKDIKDQNLKVKVTIEAANLRSSSSLKDALQQFIAFLREQDYGQPLQFTNYR